MSSDVYPMNQTLTIKVDRINAECCRLLQAAGQLYFEEEHCVRVAKRLQIDTQGLTTLFNRNPLPDQDEVLNAIPTEYKILFLQEFIRYMRNLLG